MKDYKINGKCKRFNKKESLPCAKCFLLSSCSSFKVLKEMEEKEIKTLLEKRRFKK